MNNRIDVVKWGFNLEPKVRPSGFCFRQIFKDNLEEMFDLVVGPGGVFPNHKQVGDAVEAGFLPALKWGVESQEAVLPEQKYFDLAAQNGHLNIIEYGASCRPRLIPSKDGINLALGALASPDCQNAQKLWAVLEWGAKMPIPIVPSQPGILEAAFAGRTDILEWAANLPAPVGVNIFFVKKHIAKIPINVLELVMARRKGKKTDFGPCIFKQIIEAGQLDKIKFLAGLSPRVLPTSHDIHIAQETGHPEIVKWAASLNPPIMSVNLNEIRNRAPRRMIMNADPAIFGGRDEEKRSEYSFCEKCFIEYETSQGHDCSEKCFIEYKTSQGHD